MAKQKKSVVDFVESYFEAWNKRDANFVADHLAIDGTYSDIAKDKQFAKDELIVNLREAFSKENNRYDVMGEIMSGDGTIAFQYRVSSIDPDTGEEVGVPWFGAEFITMEGGSAARIADYYQISDAGYANPSVPSQKYAKSGLSPEQLEHYKDQLATMMQTEQLYLNPDLTLPKLAALVECPVNHLSQVINAGFDMSFFDYLNQYRVEDAKKLLRLEDRHLQAILSIAFEVGFNSNSAFYAAFKKSCGQTPAQYRLTKKN